MSSVNMDELRDLCVRMREIEDAKAEAEEHLKQINAVYDELRLRHIPEKMEALGLRNATFTGIGRVQLAEDIYASTRTGQKDAGIQWLRDCGYQDMITEGYNASSAKALFRRMLKEGQPIPEEIFSITPFTRASIVKS